MKVTISICTRDREASLARTLESLARLEDPVDADWDVLVVDNASSDGSMDAARSFADRLALRVDSEPRAGLSHARNRVLDLADCDVLIWTDDDVTFSPGWLSACVEGMRRFPEAAFAGGPIVARFEGVSEEWVAAVEAAEVGCAFTWYEPGTPEGEVRSEKGPLPWGAVMAIRSAAIGDLRFDTNLGRQPGEILISGEETTFCRELLERGHHGCWLPGVRVDHHISEDRANERWIADYFFGQGWKSAIRAASDDENFRDEVERQRVDLRRHERLDRKLRRRFLPLRRRLEDLRKGSLMRGFVESSRKLLAKDHEGAIS
jgi:glycosyltransferase involved in cell wall biosynthesis